MRLPTIPDDARQRVMKEVDASTQLAAIPEPVPKELPRQF